MKEVFEVGLDIIKKIQETQSEKLEQTGHLMAQAFMEGHKFFVSGSGHSHTMAEEMYARAGGLAFVVPILTSELTMTEHPTKSSHIERLSGYAKILVDLYGVSCGDVVLIASNSGRNAYPIELALEAKNRGAHVVAITSMNIQLLNLLVILVERICTKLQILSLIIVEKLEIALYLWMAWMPNFVQHQVWLILSLHNVLMWHVPNI